MQLPEPLTRCVVPAAFSPSQLALGEECLLRAVLASVRDVPKLAAHPAAALGGVFHKLLELAVRGDIPREGSASDDARAALDRLLDEEDARLATMWPGDSPRLRGLFPPLIWRRKRRVVLDLAEKYLSGTVPSAPGAPQGRTRNARGLPANGSWSEVFIEARSLRLHGRVDLIQRTGGDVVIRDLKTGRVVTTDGDILPHIERQLRLYGAMARDVWPTAAISLVVDHGVEREVGFSREQEADVRAWLRGVLERLPPDSDFAAELLATPGDACEGCAHRHVCSAYLRWAPASWRVDARSRMPLDVWGEIIGIVAHPDGLVDLTINDAGGRTIKVFGLVALRDEAVRPGDAIWLFSLRTRDKRGGPEFWRQPHNFFECADDDPFVRAWTVQAFVCRVGVSNPV